MDEKIMSLYLENIRLRCSLDYLYQVYLDEKKKTYVNSDIKFALRFAGYKLEEEKEDE